MADCIRDMGLIFHLAFITFSSHQSAGSLEVRAIWHMAVLPLKWNPELKCHLRHEAPAQGCRFDCCSRAAVWLRPSADCLDPLRENHQLAGDISQSSEPLPGLTKHFSCFYEGLKCPGRGYDGRWALLHWQVVSLSVCVHVFLSVSTRKHMLIFYLYDHVVICVFSFHNQQSAPHKSASFR